MPNEDLTTYTETDPDNYLTVTPSSVTLNGAQRHRGNDWFLWADKGAGHFSGDYEILCKARINSTSEVYGINCFSVLANLPDRVFYDEIIQAGEDGLCLYIQRHPSGFLIGIMEAFGGSSYVDSYVISPDTDYFLKFKRDESVGTYGTLYCFIYSDAERTVLLDILSLALHTKADFQNFYAVQNFGGSTGSEKFYGEVGDFDLLELILPGPRRVFTMDTERRGMMLDTAQRAMPLDTKRRGFALDTSRRAMPLDTERRTLRA